MSYVGAKQWLVLTAGDASLYEVYEVCTRMTTIRLCPHSCPKPHSCPHCGGPLIVSVGAWDHKSKLQAYCLLQPEPVSALVGSS